MPDSLLRDQYFHHFKVISVIIRLRSRAAYAQEIICRSGLNLSQQLMRSYSRGTRRVSILSSAFTSRPCLSVVPADEAGPAREQLPLTPRASARPLTPPRLGPSPDCALHPLRLIPPRRAPAPRGVSLAPRPVPHDAPGPGLAAPPPPALSPTPARGRGGR